MQKQSFLFNFLLSPRFRFWRYLLFILVFLIMSINRALADYKDVLPFLGNKIYLYAAVIFLNYVIIGYAIMYFLIPRFLLKGKYISFILYVILAAMAFQLIPDIVNGKYSGSDNLFSKVAILDFISDLFIYILGILGVIVPVFLKNRVVESQRISQLEMTRKSSAVEQLKEQINPASFFKILNRTGTLVKTRPDRASAMLMKLSQLLRYQLYDCNRNQVLLTAEINFIRNFLEMEQLYDPGFDYSIEISGSMHMKFIRPSVLLPYVQGIMIAFGETNENKKLAIHINNGEECICLIVSIYGFYDSELLEKELKRLEERLQLLFKDNYSLTVSEDKNAPVTAEVCLKLY